ncbi:hypothetical protein NLG42_13805 [Flavobacterium plurextorum]|uniref:Uncharacterized protein n=1 Tax=Flavobacterium quisquiliarum TaxID=1834436 RepID=A0ABV8VZ08_9FLAO|nr:MULTISPECIES: hypothetical protein [Flavobacterium]MBW1653963.1 hypothetical protein [Flavobacterium quisquiliarum]UUW07178.1 hypothetical protein NLG42_13805 [Flavobacterium plurextorum]
MKTKFLDSTDIDQLQSRERVHLINSLGGFKSVSLIGTKSRSGNTNLSIFSSLFHIGLATKILEHII